MKKRQLFPITFILIIAISLLSGCNQKSFTINRVTIHAAIQSDGSMKVKELYHYSFHGTYHGTTRTINSNVARFQAYLVQKGTDHPFTPSPHLHLKTKEKDHTYKIYTKSKNESKQVLYTYTVPNVVTKYKDAGLINYSFYGKDNKTDLHHVTIDYQFPEANLSQMKGYLHDYTGKASLQRNENGYVYSTSLLPAGKSTETHFLLPASFFPDKSIDHTAKKYTKLENKEKRFQKRLSNRQEKLAAFEPLLLMGMLFLLIIALVLLVLKIREQKSRLLRLGEKDLAGLDPLYAHYLYHRLRFSNHAVIAKLLSLVKKRMVRLSVIPIEEKYMDDDEFPDETLRFTLIGDNHSLSASEQYFVGWLFTQTYEGKPSFTLDHLYGPTKKEKKDKETSNEYKKKAEQFRGRFMTWKDKLKQEDAFKRSNFKRPVPVFIWVALLITLSMLAVVNVLYWIDPMTFNAIIILDIVLGILLIIGLIIYSASPRWKIGFYIYFIGTVISLIPLHSGSETVLGLFSVLVITCLFSLCPSERWHQDKAAELKLLKEWKKRGTDQHSDQAIEQATFESLMYHAILLNVVNKFLENRTTAEFDQEWERHLPLLKHPALASSAFTSSYFIYAPSASGASPSGGGGASTGGGGAGAF